MNANLQMGMGLGALVMAMVSLVAGCSSEAMPPTQHAAISPDEVKLYPKAPSRYEAMSIISVPITPEVRWDDKGESTKGFDALKSKAAAMGANGVLLAPEAGTYDLLVAAGYKGTWYQVPARRDPKAIVARAIYVIYE